MEADTITPESMKCLQQDIDHLVRALELLGVKRCLRCRQFFRTSDPGALFGSGEAVCYSCLPDWWAELSPQLGIAEREKLEAKLCAWLRKYHGAETLRGQDRMRPSDVHESEFQLVVQCTECRGSGKLLEGERCRFCEGLGTVRIAAVR